MTYSENFTQYAATTLNNHRPQLIDNIFTARPLAFHMKEQNAIKLDGGNQIVRSVQGQVNSTPAFYAPYTGNLPSDGDIGPTAANWAWKAHAASVKVYGIEKMTNQPGQHQVIDLIESRIEVAEESIIDAWNTAFWAASPGANDFHSIPALVDSNLTGATVACGNIDPSANDWWESKVTSTVGAATFATVQNKYNDCKIGEDKPTILVSPQTLQEAYELTLVQDVRYEDTMMANAGFDSVMFKQTPWVYDEDCPAQAIYFLNMRWLEFAVDEEVFLQPTPFVRPYDKDFVVSQIITYGNLICTQRRKQGALLGVTGYT